MKNYITINLKRITLLIGFAAALLILFGASAKASDLEAPTAENETKVYEEALHELEKYMNDISDINSNIDEFIKIFDKNLKLIDEGNMIDLNYQKNITLREMVGKSEPIMKYQSTWYYMFDK